jgi:hypothetical protein
MEISPETSGVSADHRWLTETARDARWHDVELTRAFWRPAGGRWATVTAIGCKPPFRVGATQAVAHREYDGHPNHRGAAGTMTIPLPPGVRHVRRLCVAGPDNERDVTVRLWKGGFNPQARTHLRDEVVTVVIDGPGPYCETVEIHETHHPVDRYRTLSLDIRSSGFASVSGFRAPPAFRGRVFFSRPGRPSPHLAGHLATGHAARCRARPRAAGDAL